MQNFLRKTTLCSIVAALVFSNASIYAFDLGSWKPKNFGKKVAIAAGLVVFARLITKEDANKDRIDVEKDLDALIKFLRHPSLPKSVKNAILAALSYPIRFVDDVIIGFQGKKAGAKVMGTKIAIAGNERYIGTEKLPSGAEIHWFKYDGEAPYGVMGVLWANLQPVLDALGKVKTAMQLPKELGLIEVENSTNSKNKNASQQA